MYADQSYGTYKVTSDKCVRNGDYCIEGGTRTIIQDCIPNPTNNAPCLYNGKLSYDSIITTSPCDVQCYSSKWILKETTCIDNNLVDVYECQKYDETGVNDCGIIDDIAYGNYKFKQYVIKPVGSTRTKINKTNGCSSVIPEGKWVYVNSKDVIQPSDTYNSYYLSKSCQSSFQLQEGNYMLKPACLLEGNIVDDSLCNLANKPEVKLQPCRKYIEPEIINNILDSLYVSFVTININGQYLSIAESDVGTTDLILSDTPMLFMIAPRQIISKGPNYRFTAILAGIPSLGQQGWIIKDEDKLLWTPAAEGPGLEGLTSNQATLFDVTIVRDSYLTIKDTIIYNAKITLYPIESIADMLK